MIIEETLEPQIVRNVDIAVSAEDDSKNITDCPELMDDTPLSTTEVPDEKLLSSIFQPVIDTSDSPKFVTSNQSTVPLPLDMASVMRSALICACAVRVARMLTEIPAKIDSRVFFFIL